jgi:hypothetical protein
MYFLHNEHDFHVSFNISVKIKINVLGLRKAERLNKLKRGHFKINEYMCHIDWQKADKDNISK